MNNEIIINEKNVEKLEKMISEGNGKAKVRTINLEGIKKALYSVEDLLNIPKKYMEGISVDIDIWSQHFPKAYKYIPESTQFQAIYKKGNWRLIKVYRAAVSSPHYSFSIDLTEKAKEQIIYRMQYPGNIF